MSQNPHSLEKMQNLEVSLFVKAFRGGQVCVHPTDTIPGLTCDPFNSKAVERLNEIKKRTLSKTFVGLVPSIDKALESWIELPRFWGQALREIWPKPITFVWKGRENLPTCLLSERGEIALRYPILGKDTQWLYKVLKELPYPLPSTSINDQGQPPLVSKKEVENFCELNKVFLPEMIFEKSPRAQPSTVIRILDAEKFEFLREGAISKQTFITLLDNIKKKLT